MADLNSAGVEAAEAAFYGVHERGFIMRPLVDDGSGKRDMAKAITAYLTAIPTTPEAGAAGVDAVAWVSASQLDQHCDPMDSEGGNYLPVRLTAKGLFQKPLYPASALTAMQEQIDALTAERNHWMANHAEMVQRNAVLRERPDLPADRLPSIARYEAQIVALLARVEAAERRVAIAERMLVEVTGFVHRWTWAKEGNGTSDAERLDVIKHYPPIAALQPKDDANV